MYIRIPQDRTLKDGSIYCGKWDVGLDNVFFMNGCGVLTTIDGQTLSGTWEHGVRNGLFREIGKTGFPSYLEYSNNHKSNVITLPEDSPYIYGIDISHYQPVEWGAMCIVEKTGRTIRPVEFVFVKATEGIFIQDPTFRHHMKMASRVRIKRGGYHVMHVNEPARNQAMNFISTVPPWDCQLPPVLDLEAQYFSQTLNVNEVRSNVAEWLRIVESYYGVRPLIYSSRNFYNNYIKDTELSIYPIWLADYSSSPDYPEISVRQISNKGVISDWNGVVDINRIPTEIYCKLVRSY